MCAEIIRFDAPRGMRDFYPEDMADRQLVFDTWRATAESFGFLPYDSCVVESLELLKRKGGEEIVEQIYAFTDKSNRQLALRPEMTPTLARMVAARVKQLVLPLKWFAIAQCFRYERMSRGRKREHYQWNLDILGETSVLAETEVIACAVDALTRLGLTHNDAKVFFSSRALLSDLFGSLGIKTESHAATFLALDKRGKVTDEAINLILEEAGLTPKDIDGVWKIMNINSLDQAAKLLNKETSSLIAVYALLDFLKHYGIDSWVQFDISVIRGLGYYTGIVFEAFDCKRKFRALFGGGRYDRLLSDLGGEAVPAVGLGFGDVVIAELLADLKILTSKPPIINFAIGYMTEAERPAALRTAAFLRGNQEKVDLALHPEKPKNFFSRVGRGGYAKAIYLGPDDVAREKVKVKDLTNRSEEEIPLP